jgi:hypothetical protein
VSVAAIKHKLVWSIHSAESMDGSHGWSVRLTPAECQELMNYIEMMEEQLDVEVEE